MLAIIGDFLSCVCVIREEEGIVVLCLVYVGKAYSTQDELSVLRSLFGSPG